MVATENIAWTGSAAVLLISMTLLFLWVGLNRGSLRSPFYGLPPVITGIAGVGYVVLSLLALDVIALDMVEEPFEVIRYADWALTMSLIIYYLGRMVDTRRLLLLAAVGLNLVMIGTEYAALQTEGAAQTGLILVSALALAGLVFLLMRPFTDSILEHETRSARLFQSLRDLTVFLWIIYLIAFVFSPTVISVLQPLDYNFVVAVLDVLAKAGFSAILLLRQYQLETFLPGEPDVQGNPDATPV